MSSLEERREVMDSTMIRIVCSVLAIVFLGVIIMRRKKNVDE